MKNLSTAILTGVLALGTAAVQANDYGTKHSTEGKNKPAVTNPDVTPQNPTAPVPGSNSFTEVQAKERIAKAGYTGVSPLVKGEDGLWRGTAMKGAAKMTVMLDYQGNVTSAQ